jgi:hypothetical protein
MVIACKRSSMDRSLWCRLVLASEVPRNANGPTISSPQMMTPIRRRYIRVYCLVYLRPADREIGVFSALSDSVTWLQYQFPASNTIDTDTIDTEATYTV